MTIKNPLRNEPRKPIVNREIGVAFYCVTCGETYQKCKCRVYVSADTLKRVVHRVEAPQKASVQVTKTPKGDFPCLMCGKPMRDTGKQWECVCGFFYKPAVAGAIPDKYK